MKDLSVNGRMVVKTLKHHFAENFGLSLRVYHGQHFADDNATLASIRKDGCAGGELSVFGQMQVGNFENKMLEEFGIKVQVANADDTKLVDNKLTLAAASKGETKVAKKVTSAEKQEDGGVCEEQPILVESTPGTKTYTLSISGTLYGLQLAKIDMENEAVVEMVRNADLSDGSEVREVFDFMVEELGVENQPEMYFYSNCNQCIENITVETEDGEVVLEVDDCDELEELVEDNYPTPYDLASPLRNHMMSAKGDGLSFEMSADDKELADYLAKECFDSDEVDSCMAALKMDVESGLEEVVFPNMGPEIAQAWRTTLACEDEERGWTASSVRAMAVRANFDSIDEDARILAWMKYYNDATVKFEITLPEDEEFEFAKLHFIKEEDWWDCPPFYPEDINERLSETLGPIEVVEYGGKFYYVDKDSGIETGRLRDSAAAICNGELAEADLD